MFPILFVFLFSIYYLIKGMIKKQKFDSYKFLINAGTFAFVSIYSLHSYILNSLFELIDCQIIDGDSYMRIHLTVNCKSEDYKLWINLLFLPTFVFYAFLMPITAIIYLYFVRLKILSGKYQNLGFLTNGYIITKFYW
jgi:hypothetical protein